MTASGKDVFTGNCVIRWFDVVIFFYWSYFAFFAWNFLRIIELAVFERL